MADRYTPGMKLLCSSRGPDTIEVVARVTPSGIAVLATGGKVKDGWPSPKPSAWDFRSYRPATEADIARVKGEEARRKLHLRLRAVSDRGRWVWPPTKRWPP